MIAYACVLATTLLTAASDYRITVDSLGIGNSWRAGDITPIGITVSKKHLLAAILVLQVFRLQDQFQ